MRTVLVASLILFASAGCGDDAPPVSKPEAIAEDCADAATQADMNACAAEQYRAADDELNRVYRVVTRSLPEERVESIRAAQRNWIPFRDSKCESEAADVEGGSLYPTVLNACLADLTRQRTAELRAYIESDA